jgi:Xaa-Pro dipeptidase
LNQSIDHTVSKSQEYMSLNSIDGWLIYDYRYSNPVMEDTIGHIPNMTRPYWFWIPMDSEPVILSSTVDIERFPESNIKKLSWSSRLQMIDILNQTLRTSNTIAMEYSPNCELPRVSRVDAGTIELVRQSGVEVVSSADLFQYSTQIWSSKDLKSHIKASELLTNIVHEAFNYIGDNIIANVTEFEVAEFIRSRFIDENMVITDGPVVATNEHSSDPHYDPAKQGSSTIQQGDWVLIDLWSRVSGEETMSADITWTGYVGDKIPDKNQTVFDIVIGARDCALNYLKDAHNDGRFVQGCEMDKVAREYIYKAGYGEYFKHRLGHSIGKEIHSNSVNLDSYETYDTRRIIPGIAFSIEPGIYLPEFGVRSEIDVFLSDDGPIATTAMQTAPVTIGV